MPPNDLYTVTISGKPHTINATEIFPSTLPTKHSDANQTPMDTTFPEVSHQPTPMPASWAEVRCRLPAIRLISYDCSQPPYFDCNPLLGNLDNIQWQYIPSNRHYLPFIPVYRDRNCNCVLSGVYENRTRYLFVANEALYQMS